MPLVPPPEEQDDAEMASFAALLGATLGGVPNALRTMRRRPALARALVAVNEAAMARHGRATPEQKRLIARGAWRAAGCCCCQANRIMAAERLGVSAERLTAIRDDQHSPLFTDADSAAFDVALVAASVPDGVNDGLASALRAQRDDDDTVKIMGVVVLCGVPNRWNDSMGTTLEKQGRDATARRNDMGGWKTWLTRGSRDALRWRCRRSSHRRRCTRRGPRPSGSAATSPSSCPSRRAGKATCSRG
jgi:alkylhydroperoxidase family enzyme